MQAPYHHTLSMTLMELWYDVSHHRRSLLVVYKSHKFGLISACMAKRPVCMRIRADENPVCANIRFSICNRVPYKDIVTCVLGPSVTQQISDTRKRQNVAYTDKCKRYSVRRTYF